MTSVAVSLVIAFSLWRRRPASGKVLFILLMLAVSEWSLGYFFELGSAGLQNKILWAKIKYLGVVSVPLFWFFFTLEYTRKKEGLKIRHIALLAIIPSLTLLLTWTNEHHHLIWSSNALISSGNLSIRISTHGAWFWIHAAYSYLLLFFGTFQMIKDLFGFPHLYRRQIGALFAGILAPWVGNALYIYRLTPIPYLDLTPFAFTVTGIAFAWSMLRYRLFDIIPSAHITVFENMKDAVIVLDIHHRILDFNPSAKKLFNYSSSQVIGKPLNTIFPEGTQSLESNLTAAEFRTEILIEKEKRHFDLCLSPLYDKHCYMTGRLMTLRDITERKQAEEFLKHAHDKLEMQVHLRTLDLLETNEKLKQEIQERERAEQALKDSLMFIGRAKREWESTVDSLPQCIFLLDQQGKILRTNRTIEKWKIGQVKQVKGKEVHELIHPNCTDSTCYLKPFWSDAWKGVVQGNSSEHEAEDPVIDRYLHFHIQPITAQTAREGEKTDSFAIAIVNDITERKQAEREISALEEQLRQAQKIEAIGRFTGGIAHDFNNLLTPIIGYTQMTMAMLSPHDPMRDDLQEIKKAAERASTLIRQLMTFSRRKLQKPQTVSLNSILIDLDKMIRRLIGEHIEFITLLGKDLGTVKVDPGLFEQVLVNLMVNARDAMPNGGKLIVETSNIAFSEDYIQKHSGITPGQYVMCAVSDTGIGMTKEVKTHLFEPFFTTKEQGQGTGLGLSTVYGIVKQSNGHILVYSEPNQGTTFKVYLPRVWEEVTSLPRRDETGYMPRGNEIVLLVEDEPLVRTFASRILSEQGYHVLEAVDGLEALKTAKEHSGGQIHLLLTDVVMPKMGGKELADQIINLVQGIKILFTSGYTDNLAIQRGLLNPDIAFLEKPFTPFGLTRKVREVLDR
jgi:PAS domain S-box-containing protein